MASLHVLIVGAGIVGASIAWHLAGRGARVTVLNADGPGGLATRRSLAWINASWGNPAPYFHLRMRAMAEWRRLATALPALPLSWCGGLLWDLPAERLATFASDHRQLGYDIRLVAQDEAHTIEPGLAVPPFLAVHAPGEGAVEPAAAAELLLADARRSDATVAAGTTVRALTERAGRIVGVETDRGPMAADMVVLAAGVGAPALAATAGIALRVDARPALLIEVRCDRPLVRGLVMAPSLHMRQTREGAIVASASWRGGDPDRECAELFETLRSMFRDSSGLVLTQGEAPARPIPAGGLPIVGLTNDVGGLLVAACHSGITLAPAIGRFAAEMILDGRTDPLIAPFRPR